MPTVQLKTITFEATPIAVETFDGLPDILTEGVSFDAANHIVNFANGDRAKVGDYVIDHGDGNYEVLSAAKYAAKYEVAP